MATRAFAKLKRSRGWHRNTRSLENRQARVALDGQDGSLKEGSVLLLLNYKTNYNCQQYVEAKRAAKKAVVAAKAAHHDDISKKLAGKDGGERLIYPLARQTEDVEKFDYVNDV